jgi:hypothetical protein
MNYDHFLVDENDELWQYYGTTANGTKFYTPVRLVRDESRDSKREAELVNAKKIGELS